MTLTAIADEVHAEIHRAWVKFGPQYDLPNGHPWTCAGEPGTGPLAALPFPSSTRARLTVEQLAAAGELAWADILLEEVCEANEEDQDPAALRAELIQVAAVAMRWVDAIDHRARAEVTDS